jgi:glycerol uptake facilitator-like aquaporin
VTRKTTPIKAVAYWGAQILGSIIATGFLKLLYPVLDDGSDPVVMSLVKLGKNVSPGQAFLMEAVLTFILIYVIFAVAFDTIPSVKVQKANSGGKLTIYTTSGQTKAGFAPIAIGFTLGFLTFLGGTVSGGAFNPARALGPAVWAWSWEFQWLYWIADFVGAGIAGYTQLFFGARGKLFCW